MSMRLTRRTFLGTAAAAALPLRARAATPFTMQAAWVNDAEFMGYFIAMDQGLYTAGGLDFTYLSGGPDVIPETSILSGKADVALTTPDTTIKAIVEQGAPFRIIGAQYQKSPLGVVSLKASGITGPKDLIGKTLAVPPVNTVSAEAMLAMNGIKPGEVRIVPYTYDPTPLLKGEIDASIDFTTNVPYSIRLAGAEASSFLLYDAGFTIFNDTFVVTEEVLKTKRAALVAWMRASRQGWQENFKDPAAWPPKFAESHFKGTGRAIENELYFNAAQQPLIESPGGIFSMSEEGIEKTLSALGAIGVKGDRSMFDTTLLAEL